MPSVRKPAGKVRIYLPGDKVLGVQSAPFVIGQYLDLTVFGHGLHTDYRGYQPGVELAVVFMS